MYNIKTAFTSCRHINFMFCRSLTVAANNEEEKERWIEDLNMTIAQADASDAKVPYLSLKSCSK